MSTERPTGREVVTALRNTDGLVGFSAKVDRMVLAAEVRALWAEREAALALHQNIPGQGYTDDGYGDIPAACSECGTSDEYAVEWPCATVKALWGCVVNTDPTPATPRVDVYVRTRNVVRAGMRTFQIGDDITLDYQTDHNGVERLSGVEVIGARGVEVDGLDVRTGRPHGVGPAVGGAGTATPPGPDGLTAVREVVRQWEVWAEEAEHFPQYAGDLRKRAAEITAALAAATPGEPSPPAQPPRRVTEQDGGPPNDAIMKCHVSPGCRRLEYHAGPCTPATECVETTARDQAIRVIGGAIVPGHWSVEVMATAAADALGDRPDVLLALLAEREPGPRDTRETLMTRLERLRAERVETAAQVLHDRRHPLGHGHACDRCRADARAVADVLTDTERSA